MNDFNKYKTTTTADYYIKQQTKFNMIGTCQKLRRSCDR